jgi:adenylate cyclase
MSESVEIELAYLVKRLPLNISGLQHRRIEQGYISEGLEPLRVRRDGNGYELTKKFVLPDDARKEVTIQLDKQEFETLWRVCGNTLSKERYLCPLDGGLTAEIDIYLGLLRGLVKVEVEFPSIAERNSFSPPDWFGRCLEGEPWAKNVNLAGIQHFVYLHERVVGHYILDGYAANCMQMEIL